MLDFHHGAALGLNKAIVCPGPEGAQRGRQWLWLLKWAHSGHHAERVPMTDCSWPNLPRWKGAACKVTWALNRRPNTTLRPSKTQ